MEQTESSNTVPSPSASPVESSAGPPMTAPATPPIAAVSTAAPRSAAWTAELERQMRPYQRWLVVMVIATVGATCLLVSAGHGAKEGTLAWGPNSLLRVLVEMLNFNYAFPTPRGNDVKWLAQGLGAAAAVMTAGVLWYVRTGRRREDSDAALATESAQRANRSLRERIGLCGAAQLAMLAFGLWAVLSYRWAHWPAVAMGEGLRNLFVIVWAVALARTLTHRSALRAGAGMAVVLAITAIVGIWYHYERNPFLRLEFPIGNPIFFAACMLPALMLGLAGLMGSIEQLVRGPGASVPAHVGGASNAASTGVDQRSWTWITLIGSLVLLAVVGWAFRLTDSRAPAAALLAGVAAGGAAILLRWVSPARRRVAMLVLLAIALAGVVLVGRPWLESQQSVAERGRGASLRLRFYAWQYAKDLFHGDPIELPTGERTPDPLIGQGQGSYLALSQWMAISPRDQWGRSDVEMDPEAFTGELVGHAHNEWLEILAELGLVGLGLVGLSLGLTFLAGWRAFLRADRPATKWFVLALLVSLLALVIEELADVALRMPVLPLIYYTVIGLLWAMSRESEAPAPIASGSLPSWLGPAGLVAAMLAAMFITSAVRRDWRGALADGKIPELLEKQQWQPAMAQAIVAREGRLVAESHVSAGLQLPRIAHAAARHGHDQLRTMLDRQSDASARTRVRAIAQQDISEFDSHFQGCMALGMHIWAAVPGVHRVADWLADVLLMKQEIEAIKPSLGLEAEKEPYLPAARHWLAMEHRRNRFNAAAALRLLSLCGDQPMDFRIDLLRIPLRRGPEPAGSLAGIESAVRQMLAREPASFNHYLEVLLRQAEEAQTKTDSGDWPDPYAPETFRLKAIVEQVAGRYDQGLDAAARAVKLYEDPQLRFYHPTALAHGLAGMSRLQFLADPDHPAKAVDAARRALEAFPEGYRGGGHEELLRRDYSLYLLAAGQEDTAAKVIQQQVGPIAQDRLQRNLGYGLAEICGTFAERPAAMRPASYAKWLERSLALAPDNPGARVLSVRLAFEQGRFDQGIEEIKIVETNLEDPRQLEGLLQALSTAYPDNAPLKAFIAARAEAARTDARGMAPASVPATIPPDAGLDPGSPETGWESRN